MYIETVTIIVNIRGKREQMKRVKRKQMKQTQ